MNGLLTAMTPGTRLVIVGDADQLPSVGAGNVLRDIIASDMLTCIRLTEIFRQAKESMIVVNAHQINKGEYPSCNSKGTDFFLLRENGEKSVLETVKSLCTDRLPAYFTDMTTADIQILTPTRKGSLGSVNLNKEMQQLLNPPRTGLAEKEYKDKTFRCGDRVMQIKNNYDLRWKYIDDYSVEGQGVFNGDLGVIHSIDNENGLLNVLYEEKRLVGYDMTQLEELELAYAITVHKSQGSEFPLVVMPLTWFPPMLANRNLLYTAVTRAKKAVVLIGSENIVMSMVDNNQILERYSGLAPRLTEFIFT
jgi:exodeoxyribonuclease V alpha subunit